MLAPRRILRSLRNRRKSLYLPVQTSKTNIYSAFYDKCGKEGEDEHVRRGRRSEGETGIFLRHPFHNKLLLQMNTKCHEMKTNSFFKMFMIFFLNRKFFRRNSRISRLGVNRSQVVEVGKDS